jgi:endonuclease YncB( thermonuclease family)
MRAAAAICLGTALALAGAPALAAAVERCGLHAYRAEIVRVIDGDTVVADVDLGFGTWRRGERLRLAGLDAPEPRGEERARGLVSAEALRRRIGGRAVTLCTLDDRTGKYGRYLVEIFEAGESVNRWLLREGLAEALPGEG